MPWDLNGYDQFFTKIAGVENPLALEVYVDPALNGGANVLCTYTGTLIIEGFIAFGSFEPLHQSSEWSRGQLQFNVPTPGRRWTFIPSEGIPASAPSDLIFYHDGTVVASLAAIFNRNAANNAGWAVDGTDLYPLGNQDIGLRVEAKLAIRDSDGYLHRISYQVTALGQSATGRLVPPREPPRSPRR